MVGNLISKETIIARIWTGYGKEVEAGVTPQEIVIPNGDWCKKCSITNDGSDTVFVKLNTTVGNFVAGDSIPIIGGGGYTFDIPLISRIRKIYSITVATIINTSSVKIACS